MKRPAPPKRNREELTRAVQVGLRKFPTEQARFEFLLQYFTSVDLEMIANELHE